MGDSAQVLQQLADLLVRTMRAQIELAGHVMTGSLRDSVEGKVEETATTATVSILLNTYGLALDQGVPPDRIPFDFIPPYRGGRSDYIQGLQRFAQLKLGANSEKEALSIAFAIANKHKRVGLPVAGPSEFIQKTIDATEAQITKAVEEYTEVVFGVIIDNFIQTTAA